MALKFYKVLQGLTGLFKSNGRTIQSATSPSTTTIDNLTDVATTAGINKDSIVITQATANDAAQYGGKFLPGTNVMFANGQTFIDATNIVQGVYTKLFYGRLCFCAPVGSFLETDVVQFARVANLTTGDGIVIPDKTTDTAGSAYINWVLHPIDSGDADGRRNDVRIYTVKVFQKTDAGETPATNVTVNEYVAGTGLKLNDVAFSVYRNGVQITNWFQWVWNGERLVRSKGLYLPGIKEVKYENLVELRDDSKLVPGRYYKIIDYYPTTSVPYMTDGVFELKDRGVLTTGKEDGKDYVEVSPRWQIIVQALTKNRLNENAIAFNGGHDGDCAVCQIKYSLIVTSEYPWTDSTSTGVIYYMEDQNGNSANYDFKNLKFTGVKQADDTFLTNSTKIGQLYKKNSSTVLTKDLSESHWTFESLSGQDLSSTVNCTNCHIETPTPQRVVLISAKMDGCSVLNTSKDSTIYGNTVLNHVVLDRAEDCYASVTTSGIEHVNILGKSHSIISQQQFVYSNITNSDTTILSKTEIKNVNTNDYYGGPLTLLGASFQHVSFIDYCAQIRILGVTVGGTTASPTYSLGGYILYGQFNSARNIVLETNGKHFTNFTFMPGDYKANFVTPSDVGIPDQGSYTFIGGNYNTAATPTETNGMWNTNITLTRANTINNLYAPSASNFTLL